MLSNLSGLIQLRMVQALAEAGIDAMVARYHELKPERPQAAFRPLLLDPIAHVVGLLNGRLIDDVRTFRRKLRVQRACVGHPQKKTSQVLSCCSLGTICVDAGTSLSMMDRPSRLTIANSGGVPPA
jgi:hypothetical protein